MPFDDFDIDKQRQLAAAAMADERPDKWLHLGHAIIESRAWYEWHWHRGIDPDKVRPSIPQWMRQKVIERDGYSCGLCGGDVEPNDVHIDHIHPWSLGGKHEFDNLQVAHSTCNIRKGNRV